MKALRVVGLWVALVLGMASSAMAEGFALTEWSARGLGLASGMMGRADDVSAIAYNAAGITQLPGVQVMGGMGLIAPMGTLSLDTIHGKQETTTKPAVWAAPHAYASWQLNDSLWLGLGVFSRRLLQPVQRQPADHLRRAHSGLEDQRHPLRVRRSGDHERQPDHRTENAGFCPHLWRRCTWNR